MSYWFRTFIVSIEVVILLIGLFAWVHFSAYLDTTAKSLSLNDEFMKYLMLLPLALAVWIINECRLILHEDKETTRILIAWPDYQKLKTHVWVSLLYALIFASLSAAPFLVKSGLSTGVGFLLFVTSIVGQLWLAATVYAARIRVKEITAQLSAP